MEDPTNTNKNTFETPSIGSFQNQSREELSEGIMEKVVTPRIETFLASKINNNEIESGDPLVCTFKLEFNDGGPSKSIDFVVGTTQQNFKQDIEDDLQSVMTEKLSEHKDIKTNFIQFQVVANDEQGNEKAYSKVRI